ncbi:trimethylamine methyltransferase family protein [Curvivirga sp.]|uniref:trimethylamine methyltransferase family protein n=1 Tax=Curvivirga sp. TaxID=2856848 RepID=UPI003B5A40EE
MSVAEEQSTRRGRGGSRRQRGGAAAAERPHLEVPYITRNIPPYEILDEENLIKIEETADRILAEVGVEIHGDDEAIRLFTEAGAKAMHVADNKYNLTFEPGMLREILKTAPEVFEQASRNPANTIKIGGRHSVMAPSYGSPFVMDMDKGRRYGTLEDFQNFIKLAQSSPWFHHSGGTVCEPTDIPVNKRHLDMVYSHMKYSDRPFLGTVMKAEQAQDNIDMCKILFGEDFVDQNTVIMGNVNVNSPLVWDGEVTKVIRTYAAAGQGTVIVPFIMGGAMGPMAMPGAVAQTLAETMVGCALTQLVRPGVPTIFGSFLSSMSLRNGSPTFGTPEPALGSLVIGQLARRLKLPLRCAGNFSTSKEADGQAMVQGTISYMSAVQCGANFMLHSAGFLDGLLSMSYEKFVMDADLCGAMHGYMNGITVNENSLAFEAIKEVGPAHHFLDCQHTMQNYKTAYWESRLNDDRPFETWDETGQVNALTRATESWKKTLGEYEAPTLDIAKDQELQEFIKVKKESMPDAWH